MIIRHLPLLGLALCSLVTAPATAPAAEDQPERQLTFLVGTVPLAGGAMEVAVPKGMRLVKDADATYVSEEMFGNLPDKDLVAIVLPGEESQDQWAVYVSHEASGHVDDSDAAEMDADDLMATMREGTVAENKVRKERGMPSVQVDGWARKPSFDAARHVLSWAKTLKFGEDEPIVNIDQRILGARSMVLVVGAGELKDLDLLTTVSDSVSMGTVFTQGNTYADYRAGIDPSSGTGLAGLIVGGAVASKLGLIGKLLLILGKAWKLVVIAGFALLFVVKKLFAGRAAAAE